MRRWTTTALAAACLAAFVFALVHAATHGAGGGPTASASNTAPATAGEETLGMQDVPWGNSDFELFNNCQPVKVWVLVDVSDLGGFSSAEALRLVELAAESRLRAARLYKNIQTQTDGAFTLDDTYLAIRVGQVDRYAPPGFQATLDFSKAERGQLVFTRAAEPHCGLLRVAGTLMHERREVVVRRPHYAIKVSSMKRPLTVLLALVSCTLSSGAQELAERPLSNEDILALSAAGMPPQVIVAKIEASETSFDTSVPTLLELSKAGIHPDVLTAMTSTGKKPAVQSPAAPAAAGTLTVRQQASAAANVATNFEGTDCEGPGIYLRDGDSLKVLEPTTISQQQSGSGVLSRLTYGITSVKARAAIRGARASVRIENAQPKFLFCFEEAQAGLSYTTKGAVNPSEFPLVSLYVNEKKRQRSFVVGKINQWTGSRSGATPKELRDIQFDRIKAGVYGAAPLQDLAAGEYAFYFSGETPSGFAGALGVGGTAGKLFPFGVD